MGKFIIIGERIHCISPVVRKAMDARDPEPLIKRAKEQIAQGADYLEVNIGPATHGGEELMAWAVKLIQENCGNIPLCLDTSNASAIEAGLAVHNNSRGRPIVNSADAGDRMGNIDLAARNGAIVIALCCASGVPADNDERMAFCQQMLERGMALGMEPGDMWFDPLFLVVKGMQEKQMEVLEFIKMLGDMGLNSSGGLSNISNMMPGDIRPIMDSAMIAMAMYCGLTSAIVNTADHQLIQMIRSCDVIKNNTLYADSYLEL